ncbi:MAG TPA: anti-sigma factor [Xanthobacteraceae bacterium]|jgi:anti-sigma factor RsiW|nr:anti-sigma factor [Xanthobacteraceae bacterium]
MQCDEAGGLINALIDGELDAVHARDVEAHIAQCPRCAALRDDYRVMHEGLSSGALKLSASGRLRAAVGGIAKTPVIVQPAPAMNRRDALRGFALGGTVAALAASGLLVVITRDNTQTQRLDEIVSAHMRSLQADHLTDVVSTDRHTVKPWFNGRIEAAPPVIDLTAQGFALVGGRLDVIDGKATAAIVYRRREHVINLFVSPSPTAAPRAAKIVAVHGFHVRVWRDQGLDFWAVSDIDPGELQEFGRTFETALHAT